MELKVGTTYAERGNKGARVDIDRNDGDDTHPFRSGSYRRYKTSGERWGHNRKLDLVEIPQTITMDGRWAYARDPSVQVEVLTITRNGARGNVVSMDDAGGMRAHTSDGVATNNPSQFDLVKFVEPDREPRTFWANLYSNGSPRILCTSEAAAAVQTTADAETIELVEVLKPITEEEEM